MNETTLLEALFEQINGILMREKSLARELMKELTERDKVEEMEIPDLMLLASLKAFYRED